MNPHQKMRAVRIFRVLVATLLAAAVIPPAFAQTPPSFPANEGELTKSLDRDPRNTTAALTLLRLRVDELKTELLVSNFRQEYGDRVRMQRVRFATTTPDRLTIPGYIFTPVSLPKGEKRPGLLMLHGGDAIQLGAHWFRWVVEGVNHGYVVMFPEYRGSSGQGSTIAETNYGVTDLADVRGAAAFLAKHANVDAKRLGIFGHSRGGMLTLRALQEEPTRFKAAVDIAGLADMVAFMSYKSDSRRKRIAEGEHYEGKLPSENLRAYIDVSPAFFIEKIQTPVLVMSTTGDDVVPYQLHNQRVVEALKAYGKTHEAHLYDDAPGGHDFLFDDTEEGADCLRRTFSWFDKYLNP